VRPFVRLNFLVAAHDLGLLAALAERPASTAELGRRLGVERADLLAKLLAVGVGLRELRRSGATYRLRGRRARALAGAGGDVLSALAEELVLYHGRVYRDLPRVARGERAPDYLSVTDTIVARSSRVAEPFVAAWIRDALTGLPAPSLLDVGCGSGAYLLAAAQASPQATGVGLEVRPEVVALACRNLEHWGIDDRFEVHQGDARAVLGALGRSFDLALAANNVYYFAPRERVELFARLRGVLAERGSLVVVSLFEGTRLTTRELDLVLTATPGCHPLPALGAVLAELREAGFGAPAAFRLVPGESLFAVRAVR